MSRSLPSAPAFAAHPAVTPDMRVGESCWVAYDRKRSGEISKASIIRRYNDWYGGVSRSYSTK